jgi:murein DD-endopeptidase MepM/ murein hydrolase activator NlpD
MPTRVIKKTTTTKPPKPPKVTTTTTTAKPVSPPPPAETIGAPVGVVPTNLKIAYGRGVPWSNYNRYDQHFLEYGLKHGVPPEMLKAMAVIEADGTMIWNQGGSGAFGIMQIKSAIWKARADALGYNLQTPEGQIAMAAAILGGDTPGVRGNTPEERFLSTFYPTASLDTPGEDGHTPRQYLADMHTLMDIIAAAEDGVTPAPVVDVFDLLFGGKPYSISAGYGQRVTWSCPGCYDYFTAYGLPSTHHWAYDVSAHAGDGAPLYAPFNGTVVCAGTGVGNGAWGTGCVAFDYRCNYNGCKGAGSGHGRIELLHEDGDRSLIIGHALRCSVSVGTRVKTSDLIGQQGGMNGSHVHAEGRLANGTRIGDPRQMFGDGAMGPTYAERVPVPQPGEWDSGAPVTITRDGVPLLQRARKDSVEVESPFKAGDRFEAVQLVWSEDEKAWYWVSKLGTRVPLPGTKSDLLGTQ